MKRVVTAIGLSVLVFAVVGCGRLGPTGGAVGGASAATEGDERRDAAAADRQCDLLVAGKDEEGDRAAEARDWLDPKHPNHMAWKIDKKKMLAMTTSLYAGGAAKVFAVYSPPDDTVKVEMCAELLVELPTDAAARTKALDACRKIDRDVWGEDADKLPDVGQKYVRLNLDP